MARKRVDLSAHINLTVERGHAADFPVALRPLFVTNGNGRMEPVPKRMAVVRTDTGQAISVVSDRYTLVPHQRLLDVLRGATRSLDVGPVPHGVYVDRRGARMRAILKFPALRQVLLPGDEICPCVKVVNTYDGTARIAVSIGAFRFVCTNLAVGGGGVFAGGFMAVHAGVIPVEEAGAQLTRFLEGFERIIKLYRYWQGLPTDVEKLPLAVEAVPTIHRNILLGRFGSTPGSVLSAYNLATEYATHETRSAAVALGLLETINNGFLRHLAGPANPR